jgi:glucose dehydrogenase
MRRFPLLSLLLVLGLVAPWAGAGLAQEAPNLYPGPAIPTALGPAIPPELTQYAGDWPAPQGNLAGTRAAVDSAITAATVGTLQVAWRLPIEATGAYGGMTATPLVAGDTVYVQDMLSNVFALDRETGAPKWTKEYEIPSIGPNGLALGYGMVYGPLGDTAEVFALTADSGAEVWRVKLSANPGEGVDVAPTVYNSTVYVSTVPGTSQTFYGGGRKGIFYALDAGTGAVLWQFDTTTDNLWGNPRVNSGGGLWQPPSVDADGNLYFGTGNPGPFPGGKSAFGEFPNATSRPGDNLYTCAMVSLDGKTGAVRWSVQARPHDLFDLDFQATPILTTATIDGKETTLAIGSGKAGYVIAANAETGGVVWQVAVGKHQNDDLQAVPAGQTVEILPGVLGGVETPMAYADGTVFVPVINLPVKTTEFELDFAGLDLTQGTGELVALNVADGSVKWQVDLPAINVGAATVANDVVITATLDGLVRAFDANTGAPLATAQLGAGINAPPAIAGDLLLVAAAGPRIGPEGGAALPEGVVTIPVTLPAEPGAELIAFRLPA